MPRKYWTATGSEGIDEGLYEETQQEGDRYVFRVSMLRNIARTGPYFHDGSVATLEEAVRVMSKPCSLAGRSRNPISEGSWRSSNR